MVDTLTYDYVITWTLVLSYSRMYRNLTSLLSTKIRYV